MFFASEGAYILIGVLGALLTTFTALFAREVVKRPETVPRGAEVGLEL